MNLIDTHCHLDLPQYKDDLEKVIENAASSGVIRIIAPGISVASSIASAEIAAKHEPVFFAAGIHPHEADKVKDADIAQIRSIAIEKDKVVAIGEIGLDKYKGYSKLENQVHLLKESLKIAKDLELPVILHNRNAGKELVDILGEMGPLVAGGVVHCFSSDKKILNEILSMGLHISFTGNITFPGVSELRDLLQYVPVERLMLETDGPYMAPDAVRGKRNEPAYVKHLLYTVAEAYDISTSDVARVTTHNANQLFKLGIEEKPAIAYEIRDSLYLNITNRCTNRCTFCTRKYSNFVMGHNLKLDSEPTKDQIISNIGDVSKYKEVVFCGYGEPTLRLGVLKEVAGYVKEKGAAVRLTTNGQGNLINGRNIAAELKGLIDKVSISLNAPLAVKYQHICRSVFGENAYDEVIAFIKECKDNGIEVSITCLDMVGEEGVKGCKDIAEQYGADFRLRHLDAVG